MNRTKFDKIIAKYYDEVVEKGYHNQKKYIKGLLKIIPKGSSILEIGCGTGQIAISLREGGRNIECLDESESMVSELKIKNKKVKVKVGSLARFKTAKKYDYVLSCNGPFSIKGKEIESYLLNKRELVESIKKCILLSKRGLLINKGKSKQNLRLKLNSGKIFFHKEMRKGNKIKMINELFQGRKKIGEKILIKRRYPIREVFGKTNVKNFSHFKLLKEVK